MRASEAILSGLLLALLAGLLSSCVAGVAYGPSVVVGSLSLASGASGHTVICVRGLGDLQGLQVGPKGRFTFNPRVVRVKEIAGLNGFQVFASQVDNAKGEAVFLAAYPGGGSGEDGIVQIELEAFGPPGSSSPLLITSIDLLADSRGNEITNYEIINGQVVISPGTGP